MAFYLDARGNVTEGEPITEEQCAFLKQFPDEVQAQANIGYIDTYNRKNIALYLLKTYPGIERLKVHTDEPLDPTAPEPFILPEVTQ